MKKDEDHYLEVARQAKNQSDWGKAIYYYSLSAELNPPNLASVLIDRGFAYFQLKRYRHAKTDYEAAKRLLETRSYDSNDSRQQVVVTARLIYLY